MLLVPLLVAVMPQRKQRNRPYLYSRYSKGAFHQLRQELCVSDVSSYRNFVSLDAAIYTFGLFVVPFLNSAMFTLHLTV